MGFITIHNNINKRYEWKKEETLGNFLNKKKLSRYFIEYHLIPMVAAICSIPFNKAKEMPL